MATIDGTSGDDILVQNAGENDVVDGKDGTDTLDLSGMDEAATLNLNNGGNQRIGASQGLDRVLNVENIIGTRFGDRFTALDAGSTIEAGGGDDTVIGGPGDDALYGGDNNDRIIANGGDDTVYGGAGTDNVNGGDGDDELHGDEGRDTLVGDGGDDTLYGGDGNDTLRGRLGMDTLYGGAGNDSIVGEEDDDTAYGGDGNDNIKGSIGNDTLYGDAGVDTMDGQAGDDTLYGGDDNDRLFGGSDNDEIYGGLGDDLSYAGIGDDTQYGGAGDDFLLGGGGNDMIDGDEGDDALVGNDGNDQLFGGEGADRLRGHNDHDVLFGGTGDDSLTGEAGNDILYGEEGADNLKGNAGEDILFGGLGDDVMDGGSQNDTLIGEEGEDRLVGGSGDDRMFGGIGDDTLYAGDGQDTLDGGAGTDVIRGGGGDDVIVGSTGDDLILGDAGLDIVDYRNGVSGLTVTLNNGSTQFIDGAGLGTHRITDIEGFYAPDFDSVLIGDGKANVFRGGAGDDIVQGGGNNDVLQSFSDAGDTNTFSGGPGADRFEVTATHQTVIITDFTPGSDTVAIDADGQIAGYQDLLTYLVAPDTFQINDLTLILQGVDVAADTTGGDFDLSYNPDNDTNPVFYPDPDDDLLSFTEDDTFVSFDPRDNDTTGGANSRITRVEVGYFDQTNSFVPGHFDGTVRISADYKSLEFIPDPDAYNGLGAGDAEEFVVTYWIRKQATSGGSTYPVGEATRAEILVSVTGVNDAVEIGFSDLTGDVSEITDGAPGETVSTITTSGVINFTDPDLGDSHSASWVANGVALGSLSLTVSETPGTGIGDVEWTYSVADAAVEYLAEGETRTESFTITVDDGQGGPDTAIVTVTITGANDAATITGTNTGDVIEDDPATASGKLDVADVDAGEAKFVVPVDLDGAYGSFNFDEDGNWTYELNSNLAAIQSLADGETLTDTLMVSSFDGTASETLTVTITGTNDGPVAGDDDGSAILFTTLDTRTGNEAFLASVFAGGPRPPSGPNFDGQTLETRAGTLSQITLSVEDNTPAAGGTPSTFRHTLYVTEVSQAGGEVMPGAILFEQETETGAGQHELSFDIDGVDLTQADQFAIILRSEILEDSSPGISTIRILATPDSETGGIQFRYASYDSDAAMVFSGDAAERDDFDLALTARFDNPGRVYEDDVAVFSADRLLANDSDVDATDTLSIAAVTDSALGATVLINADGDVVYDPTGVLDYLAEGETVTDSFTYTVSDGDLTDTATVSFTVNGLNDAPVAADDVLFGGAEAELDTLALRDSQFEFRGEQPLNDRSYHAQTFTSDGEVLDAISIATTHVTGSDAIEFHILITEITGTGNDFHPGAVLFDSGQLTGSGPGEGEVITRVETGGLSLVQGQRYAMVLDFASAWDGEIGYGRLAITRNADQIPDEAAYASDVNTGDRAADFQQAFIQYEGTRSEHDVAMRLEYHNESLTDEDTAATIFAADLLANDSDVDATDTLSIAAVTDSALGATVSINADGDVVYDPTGALDYLAEGETVTDSFTYTVDDGHGGTDTATVTLTVHGVNDAPVTQDDFYDPEPAPSPVRVLVIGTETSDIEGAVAQLNDDTFFDFEATGYRAPAMPEPGLDLTAWQTMLQDFDVVVLGRSANIPETQSARFGELWQALAEFYRDGGGFVGTSNLFHFNSGIGSANAALLNEVSPGNTAALTSTEGPNGTIRVTIPGQSVVDGLPATISTGSTAWTVSGADADSQVVALGGAAGTGNPLVIVRGATDDHGASVSLGGYYLGETGTGIYEADPLRAGVFDQLFEQAVQFAADRGPVLNEDAVHIIAADELLANDSDVDASDTLSIAAVTDSALGAGVTLNADGTISYDPTGVLDYLDEGETVTDSFTYTVSDGHGGTGTATVSFTVNGINDAPVAQDDMIGGGSLTDEDTAITILADDLLANDSDVDASDTLSVSAVSNSALGATVSLDTNGDIVYNPAGALDYLAEGETVTDSFTYTVDDGHGGSDTATVTLTVHGVNDAPTVGGAGASATVSELLPPAQNMAPYVASGSFGFADVDLSDTHTVSVTAQGSGYFGSLTAALSADSTGTGSGGITWTFSVDEGALDGLDEGETSVQSYLVTVDDGEGGTASETVTITLNGAEEAQLLTGFATGTDPDVVNSENWAFVSVDHVTEPSGGSHDWYRIDITEDGTNVVFDIDHAYEEGGSFDAFIALYSSTNQLVAHNDDATAEDPGSQPSTPHRDSYLVTTLDIGTYYLDVGRYNGNGPEFIESLPQGATYELQVSKNVPTVIGGDLNVAKDETDNDLSFAGTLSAVDPDGPDNSFDAPIPFGYSEQGDYGSFNFKADGSWTYRASSALNHLDTGEFVTDSFTVSSVDGTTATVTITINGTNDAPVAQDDVAGPVIPEVGLNSLDDVTSTFNGLHAYVAQTFVATGEALSLIEFDLGSTFGASLLITTIDGDASFNPDQILFETTIGTSATSIDTSGLSFNVGQTYALVMALNDPLNDASFAVAGETADPDGSLYIMYPSDAAYTYATDFASANWNYLYNDLGLRLTYEVQILTDEDTSATILADDLLANDFDVEGDALSVSAVSAMSAAGAAVSLNIDGDVVYDPTGAFDYLQVGETATDSFTYTVDDGHGGSDTATVTLTVHGVNDAPVAGDDVLEPLTTVSDLDTLSGSGFLNVLWFGEDSNHRGDAQRYVAQTFTATGEQLDQIEFKLSYADGYSDQNFVVLVTEVGGVGEDFVPGDILFESAVQTLPISGPGSFAIDTEGLVLEYGQRYAVILDAGRFYDNGEDFSFLWVASGSADPDNQMYSASPTSTPDADLVTPGWHTFSEYDLGLRLDFSTREFTEDAPRIIDTSDLLANDSDAEGDVLTLAAFDGLSDKGATVWMNSAGDLIYDPRGAVALQMMQDGEAMTDSFTYTVSDGNGVTDTATVSFTVAGAGGEPFVGGPNNDVIFGSDIDGDVFGGAGEDSLLGTAAGGSLFGGDGRDIFSGGEGDEYLFGGADGDDIRGFGGDDVLFGGAGNDVLRGDGGADLFVIRAGMDIDLIADFNPGEGDRITSELPGLLSEADFMALASSPGGNDPDRLDAGDVFAGISVTDRSGFPGTILGLEFDSGEILEVLNFTSLEITDFVFV